MTWSLEEPVSKKCDVEDEWFGEINIDIPHSKIYSEIYWQYFANIVHSNGVHWKCVSVLCESRVSSTALDGVHNLYIVLTLTAQLPIKYSI